MLQKRVERELTAFGDVASWLDYRLYLCRMYGFLSPIERALARTPDLATAIHDAGLRNHKAALLADDLASLGVERLHLAQIPQIAPPVFDEVPEALGWMYVIESSTLEGAELARHLALRLPSELDCASTYLRCYGEQVEMRWHEFGAAINAYVDATAIGACDRIVLAATDCLIRLHRWLTPSSSAAISQLRAGRLHA